MKGMKIYRGIMGMVTAIAMAGMLGACSAGKKATKATLPTETPAEISQQTPSQRYTELCNSYGWWEDVQMPVRLSLTAPKNLSVNARAAMKRGEWISLSVRMLGFEVASAFVDRDSVHVVDRYHKAYLSESLEKVFGEYGVTVETVQDLLLGRGFLLGKAGGTMRSDLKTALEFVNSPEGLMILPSIHPEGLEYGFILSPDANRVAAASVAAGERYSATASYSQAVETPQAGVFASTTDIRMVKGKNISATLDWSFSQAKWNTGVSRSWKQPSGYSRIDAKSLISKLTKL